MRKNMPARRRTSSYLTTRSIFSEKVGFYEVHNSGGILGHRKGKRDFCRG
jgi:hypothetical protein